MFEQQVRPRVGIYSTGLKAYWAQFETLHDRLVGYGQFIADKLAGDAEVYNFGLVDLKHESLNPD